MTTHLTKVHPYNGKTHAACRSGGYTRSHQYLAHSEDRSMVDCTRCAKIGGFEPKAKRGPTNPGGTCQVCFAEQRVLGGERMTLHGYIRPGIGYIIGDCRGSRALPFEKSCDLTKSHREALAKHLQSTENHLKGLQNGAVTQLSYEAQTSTRNPDYTFRRGGSPYLTKLLTVKFGDKAIYNLEGFRSTIPSFEDLLERAIFQTEQEIRNLTRELNFLDEKLAGWSIKDLLP